VSNNRDAARFASTEIWDIAGIPLSQLNQSSIMTAENMVDAALAGFDQGEAITLPSVDDAGLWDARTRYGVN
jgi:uncharacterized protein